MDNETIILYVGIGILFIFFILLCILNVYLSLSKIDPNNCPKSNGQFGLQIDRNGKVQENCGTNASSICSFKNIVSLTDAVYTCNAMHELCNAFTYNKGIMNIIDQNSLVINNSKIGNNKIEVYVRQV